MSGSGDPLVIPGPSDHFAACVEAFEANLVSAQPGSPVRVRKIDQLHHRTIFHDWRCPATKKAKAISVLLNMYRYNPTGAFFDTDEDHMAVRSAIRSGVWVNGRRGPSNSEIGVETVRVVEPLCARVDPYKLSRGHSRRPGKQA